MLRLSRRRLLQAAGASAGFGAATTSYAVGIEPGLRLAVRRYQLALPGWNGRPPLEVCVTADLHAGEPWMPLARVQRIVAAANALAPDLHVILGDLPAHHRFVTRRVPMQSVVEALAGLQAPLGRYAILGNHDWWDDPLTQRGLPNLPMIQRQLLAAGIPVLANHAVKLPHGGGVWLAGTDSALAFGPRRPGAADLPRAISPLMADDHPALLLIHEPDLFPSVPSRIGLTLAGHTHGGQVRLFGYSPVVPSRFGNRFAYGLVEEGGRRMIVSGGLGCSLLPVRLGVPPELTLVRIEGPHVAERPGG